MKKEEAKERLRRELKRWETIGYNAMKRHIDAINICEALRCMIRK